MHLHMMQQAAFNRALTAERKAAHEEMSTATLNKDGTRTDEDIQTALGVVRSRWRKRGLSGIKCRAPICMIGTYDDARARFGATRRSMLRYLALLTEEQMEAHNLTKPHPHVSTRFLRVVDGVLPPDVVLWGQEWDVEPETGALPKALHAHREG